MCAVAASVRWGKCFQSTGKCSNIMGTLENSFAFVDIGTATFDFV